MRLILDKENGLSLVNENGDISVKCRKLIIEAQDDTYLTMNKDLTITCQDDTISMNTQGAFCIKSGKEVVLKGKNKISVKGDGGVTAGFQQIAKEDDMVVGVDMHDIMVPSSTGLVTVPMIPHPYVGKLADELSQDVEINNKPAATKGSKSKYNTPGHIAMPPGVKFKSNPSNEGEVSSGVVSNVKINDKEAAVLGSMVKTCNDPQDQETCTIIAVGAPVILPIMMPGMDPDQFEKDGGTVFNSGVPVTTKGKTQQADKQPKLQNPEWSTETAKVGEEVTLSVELVDQYEYANVTFKIWEEGADRENDMPITVLKGQNVDGKAEVKWRYQYIHDPGNPLTEKPKFVFTAKSFRCDEVESGSCEVSADIKCICRDSIGDLLADLKYYILKNGEKEKEGKTDEDGIIDEKDCIPGQLMLFDLKDYKKGEENKKAAKEIIQTKNKVKTFTMKDIEYIDGIASDPGKVMEVILQTLIIRLKIDPNQRETADDEYTLYSTDPGKSYECIQTVKDDRKEGDRCIDLHFVGMRNDLNYTLEISLGKDNGKYTLFKNMPLHWLR